MEKLMKIAFLGLLVLCFSCGNDSQSASTSKKANIPAENVTLSKRKQDRVSLRTRKMKPAIPGNGRYRKLLKNVPAGDCNCNCIDVDFDKPSEWCIVKDKVYISAQCRKSGKNSVDIYFVNVSREDAPDRPLPWKDFDTDKPIASIAFQPGGDAELDWKGFSIDGKIATDYAIFGKKTLEGTYKKE